MNMSKQCSPEDETMNKLGKKSSTTLLGNKDEDETREQQHGGEIAALTGDIRAGFTKMANENPYLKRRHRISQGLKCSLNNPLQKQ